LEDVHDKIEAVKDVKIQKENEKVEELVQFK